MPRLTHAQITAFTQTLFNQQVLSPTGRLIMTSYKFNPFALDLTDAVAVPSPIPQDTRAKLVDGVLYDCEPVFDTHTKTDLAGVPEGDLTFIDNAYAYIRFYQIYSHIAAPYLDRNRAVDAVRYALTPNDMAEWLRHRSKADYIFTHTHHYAVKSWDDADKIMNEIHWFVATSPWHGESRIVQSSKIWCEHLPRISEKFPGMLAYYQSPAKRARGILTPIKPGRYLNKFFSHLLTGEEINRLAVKWEVSAVPPELSITQDADEIEAVYENAYLGSCMCFSHKDVEWDGSEHPARIFAGPDLGIAYLGPKAAPVARVLVWPSKKLFLYKAYGDTYRIKDALKAKGYAEAEGHKFEGAAVRRIPYRGDRVVAPYLDACEYLAEHPTDENLLILSDDGGYQCQNTNGLSDINRASYATCEITGDRYPEDDLIYIEAEDIHVCTWALHEYFVQDSVTHEYIRKDDAVRLYGRSYIRYIRYTLPENDGVYECDHYERHYLDSEVPSYMTHDGLVISEAAYDAAYGRCEHDEEVYPDSDLVELSDGRTVFKEYQEELEAELAAQAEDVAA